MFKFIVLVALIECCYTQEERRPMYKYRYETEDVMKTAASNVPVHGYHSAEGGYYPRGGLQGSSTGIELGGYNGLSRGVGGLGSYRRLGGFHGTHRGAGLGGFQGSNSIGRLGGYSGGLRGGIGYESHGANSIGRLGGYSSGLRGGIGYEGLQGAYGGRSLGYSDYGGGLEGIEGDYINGRSVEHYPISSQVGLGGFNGGISPIHHHHHQGGEIIDKTVYSGGKKNLNDGSYEKSNGKKGEQVNQNENGFSQGKVGLLNSKGDAGYYNDEVGEKKIVEDGKNYNGQEHFNQEGKNADEKKEKSGHKKGHVVKGFKTSHHKDETGKTEEYYDEAHDEGDKFNFAGQSGKFGEGAQSSFKGGHDDSYFNADERKKQGNYNSDQFVDKNNADAGQYGQRRYLGNGEVYGVNNGVDQQSLLGHQESSRIFKHHPYHVPFYHH